MKTLALISAFATTFAVAAAQTAADPFAWLSLYEEENLARDLYARFEASYQLPVFGNIERSEERHIAAVATLLETRGITVPAHATGSYNDVALQAVYDQLAAQGDASLVGALRAGALVEELDIADLDELLARSDLTTQDRLVFSNLRTASMKHLNAFVRGLAAQGELYTPAVLDDASFTAILDGTRRGRKAPPGRRSPQRGRG